MISVCNALSLPDMLTGFLTEIAALLGVAALLFLLHGVWRRRLARLDVLKQQNETHSAALQAKEQFLQEIRLHRDHLQEQVTQQTAIILQEQENLKRAKEAAENANAAKSDFLAHMSHELRTPLNSIIGLAQLINDGSLTAAQQEMLHTMEDASTNLLAIVNDILDIAKIESGHLELENVPFSPYVCLTRVMNMMMPVAKKRAITLALHAGKTNTDIVLGDPVRYSRILTNLISNAIKYTEYGSVDVYLTAISLPENKTQFQVNVMDTGIGIPADKLQSIFEKFTQADLSTTRKYGGSGLGLAITKQLIERMQGEITVHSIVGKGSNFGVSITFEATEEDSKDHEDPEKVTVCGILHPSSVRVLVAEDHQLNQAYLQRLLPALGITHFTIVGNGIAARDEALSGAYDLVLMDCHMPKMTGYVATQEIRAGESERRTLFPLPIIAMTANAMIGERERCIQCGMDDYISKPVTRAHLKQALARWLRFDAATPPPPDDTTATITTTSAASTLATLDVTTLRTFSEGEATIEQEFVNIFVTQCAKHLEQLGMHCVAGYCSEWSEIAHAIKGSAATMGALKLREIATIAQEMLTASIEDRQRLRDQMHEEFTSVCAQLRQMQLLPH